ncbi:hypothetical protein BAE44_0005660 [Dichanthelium oligosanthes]|uniref:NAC domain-containing protein n=1 Tax=Dichanthelium oligosanthes TaxID=888268 RepID=A0A1E5W7D3_9POAL|nr:hypothetical protein BAE44_0005660 [Dichanthelium oligosanthes]
MACKTIDGELIALLRGLRAGAVNNSFVHRVDVCSAAPAELVTNLEPVPGTDLTEDGYNGVWYFYCKKRYKNAQGKPSGHRQRAIGGGDTCWHSEARPKVVEGSEGGTFCNLSYGRKNQGSAGRSFERLGWCMIEYDDTRHGGGDHVLCKVYRSSSSLAKGKPKSSSSSSKSTSSSKRKAAGDHAEARPTKLIYDEQMQQDYTIFSNNYPMPCYEAMNPMFADVEKQKYIELDQGGEYGLVPSTMAQANAQELIGCPAMIGGEEEQHLQQPSAELAQDSEFVETEYGLLPCEVAQINAEEWISCPEMFEGEECQCLQQESGQPEQDGQDGEFVETPCGALVEAETTVEELLELETTSGVGSGMPLPGTVTPPDDDFFVDVDGESLFGVQEEEQSIQMQQQPRTDGDLFIGMDRECGFGVQEEEHSLEMQQQPCAEPDPMADFIQSLTPRGPGLSLLPNPPSTRCSAMPWQQQGSHWMQMQPLQLPSPYRSRSTDMAAKISDGELIALLRGLRAGVDNRFVHRVDVCSAAPADLVANLEPVPGTDSIWYFYSPKKYKNARGKTSGHRQRAIGGGDTCWHSEARPKVVDGSEGGTFCNLSYGRKKQGSAGRSFDRPAGSSTDMAADDSVSCTSDDASIALLRRLLAGATVHFVYHVDVCSAAPEDFVADLEPVPGTDLTQYGYNSVWYFYSKKRYKNAQGKPSGHRQRAIGGGDTCWHSEARPKLVEGSEGGTFCNLSYGRKKQGSSRSFDRLGWCMIEYDDMQHGGGDHVLCKVYRSTSSLAKGKPKSSSSSSKSTSSSKRKAAGDHAEARPTKLIYDEQMQQQHEEDTIFSDYYLMPCYEGMNLMFGYVEYDVQQQQQQYVQLEQGGEYGLVPSTVAQVNVQERISCPEIFEGEVCHQHLQQQSGEPEQGAEFVEIPCGDRLVPLVSDETTMDELLDPKTTSGVGSGGVPLSGTVTPPHADFFVGLDPEYGFGVQEEEQSMEMRQQPRAEPDPMAEFIQSLKTPRGPGRSSWPNSPSTMACQQQESHWMHPLQLPFLIC